MSTGVIGVQLPLDKVTRGVDLALQALNADNWEPAARAIMTTDTRPKMAASTADGYTIAGMAKGAGMIAPNMATMLSFIQTDARLSPHDVQTALRHAVGMTFNRIVVDGDMSTNDTVLLLANGASAVSLDNDEECQQFQTALEAVAVQLAQAIVRDGEGVTKFITVHVQGLPDDAAAHQIANTIANSPLVKTAFYGNDANWGRILMAAGRAGVEFDQEQVALWIAPGQNMNQPLQLVANGMVQDFDEADSTAIVSQPEVCLTLKCGAGSGSATVWTCDLSHEYVSINADYRT
jgi:glutamate N-acetyltransferase/amino-acid N-acetyltransferase